MNFEHKGNSPVKTVIRKGDMVQVLSGKDKGQKGRVLSVMPKAGKALVEHVGVARKHRRQRSAQDQGGIVSIEMPVPLCKLALLSDDMPTRVRIVRDENGARKRVSVRTGKDI